MLSPLYLLYLNVGIFKYLSLSELDNLLQEMLRITTFMMGGDTFGQKPLYNRQNIQREMYCYTEKRLYEKGGNFCVIITT